MAATKPRGILKKPATTTIDSPHSVDNDTKTGFTQEERGTLRRPKEMLGPSFRRPRTLPSQTQYEELKVRGILILDESSRFLFFESMKESDTFFVPVGLVDDVYRGAWVVLLQDLGSDYSINATRTRTAVQISYYYCCVTPPQGITNRCYSWNQRRFCNPRNNYCKVSEPRLPAFLLSMSIPR